MAKAAVVYAGLIALMILVLAVVSVPIFEGNLQSSPSNCQQYLACVYVRIDSNSSISGLSISMSPEPTGCLQGYICDPIPAQCGLPSVFCNDINTQASTASFSFQGVTPGYYWFTFTQQHGLGATQSVIKTIDILNNTAYYVRTNITGDTLLQDFSITTNSTST